MLRWMIGIKRIENIRTDDIRARAGVANISGTSILRWKMEWNGHRNVGREQRHFSTVIRTDLKEYRETKHTPDNVDNETSMRRPQIGKRPKKNRQLVFNIL